MGDTPGTERRTSRGKWRLARLETSRIRQTPLWVVGAFLLLDAAVIVFVNGVVFTSPTVRAQLLAPMWSLSGGLVCPKLVVNLSLLGVGVGGLVLGIGGLRPRDLGLRPSAVRPALLAIVVLWLATQAIGAVLAVTVDLEPGSVAAPSVVAGEVLAQVLGTALYEEIAFRGFLLVQVEKRLRSQITAPDRRLVVALLVTSVVFTLTHIPNRLTCGIPPDVIMGRLPVLLLAGIVFGLVYYRTENLLLAVAIHALANAPARFFVPREVASVLAVGLGLAIAVVWPWLTRTHETPLTSRT